MTITQENTFQKVLRRFERPIVYLVSSAPFIILLLNFALLYVLADGMSSELNPWYRFFYIFVAGSFINMLRPYLYYRFKNNAAVGPNGQPITATESVLMKVCTGVAGAIQVTILILLGLNSYYFLMSDGSFWYYIETVYETTTALNAQGVAIETEVAIQLDPISDEDGLTKVLLNFLNMAGGIAIDILTGTIAGSLLEEGGGNSTLNSNNNANAYAGGGAPAGAGGGANPTSATISGITYNYNTVDDQKKMLNLVTGISLARLDTAYQNNMIAAQGRYQLEAEKIGTLLGKVLTASPGLTIRNNNQLEQYRRLWSDHVQQATTVDANELARSFNQPNAEAGTSLGYLFIRMDKFTEYLAGLH